MNSQQNFLNVQFDDGYFFPPNVAYAAEPQIQQQNTQYLANNQIYPPQVEYQTIQQVYQPNIGYPVDRQQTNQSNTEYQTNYQFYQPNADLNLERELPTSLPQKEKAKRNRTRYTDEQTKCLEEHFKKNQYITLEKKKELAAALGIKEEQIKKWYANRRRKEKAKLKANCLEGNENQPLPSQSIGNVRDNDHRISLNPMNLYQYNNNNMYPEAISPEVHLNVNSTQNLGEPKEDNSNNYYAYDNPNGYGKNLIQIPGVILPTPLENIHPLPLQQNYQNILNNFYYGNNIRNENLTQNIDLIEYPPLESINPLQLPEDFQNISNEFISPYNEHWEF